MVIILIIIRFLVSRMRCFIQCCRREAGVDSTGSFGCCEEGEVANRSNVPPSINLGWHFEFVEASSPIHPLPTPAPLRRDRPHAGRAWIGFRSGARSFIGFICVASLAKATGITPMPFRRLGPWKASKGLLACCGLDNIFTSLFSTAETFEMIPQHSRKMFLKFRHNQCGEKQNTR